jgi:anthranilate synthase component 1
LTEINAVKPPFDIAGDLDTPVSAFAKLGAFNPRFLLESVEGGERLARYSFIGFGDCLEVRLDAAGLTVGNAKLPRPANKAELLDALRKALAAAPKPLPEMAGVPLAGGLVGYFVIRRGALLRAPAVERARRRTRCRTCTTSRPSPCWCSIT